MDRKRRGLLWSLTAAMFVVAGACDDDGTGPNTNTPAAPTNVSALANGSDVTVSWTGTGDSFNVQRQAIGGAFSTVGSGVTGTSYTDTGVPEGTYNYRVIAVVGGNQSNPSDPALVEVGSRAVLSGAISGDRTLSADSSYLLRGIVTVEDGGSLTIPAGTTVLGDVATQPTALIVRTGGQIFAQGTETDPVVFTSSAPEGQRRAGDWGGVVLNGRSLCNFPAGECIGEGSSGEYGGSETEDNSGSITYTRVEFAGFEVSFGNELNALTLNGVGSGTEIHHVQTNVGLDDGIEFFGGTVDLKYAIVTNASDDSFDYSTGWQGRGQFWIVQQDPDDADTGFEVDGNEDNFNATPLTDPQIYNITVVGTGPAGVGGSESTTGLLLRRGTAGTIWNAVVMGFGNGGLDIDNGETISNGLEIRNSILADNASNFVDDDDGINESGFFGTGAWSNREEADAMLTDPYNRDAPDFTPMAGSPLLTGAAAPPDDGFFTVVDYVGAADPAGGNWWEGWTSFARN